MVFAGRLGGYKYYDMDNVFRQEDLSKKSIGN